MGEGGGEEGEEEGEEGEGGGEVHCWSLFLWGGCGIGRLSRRWRRFEIGFEVKYFCSSNEEDGAIS